MSDNKEKLAVFTIIPAVEEGGKDFWQRIGTAFVNKDLSMNVVLNALPLDGKLHLRKPREQDPA